MKFIRSIMGARLVYNLVNYDLYINILSRLYYTVSVDPKLNCYNSTKTCQICLKMFTQANF